ncbi:hypothetical protein ACVWW4_007205 [Bradyrhizobium sp. LB7.1]
MNCFLLCKLLDLVHTEKPASARMSRPCWPSVGAGPAGSGWVTLQVEGTRIWRMRPSTG